MNPPPFLWGVRCPGGVIYQTSFDLRQRDLQVIPHRALIEKELRQVQGAREVYSCSQLTTSSTRSFPTWLYFVSRLSVNQSFARFGYIVAMRSRTSVRGACSVYMRTKLMRSALARSSVCAALVP